MFVSRLFSLALMAMAGAAGGAVAQTADLSAKADAIVAAAFPADGPGAAVVITRGGRTVYASGRGLADVEARRPITPETVFRLGSLTKTFTAAAVLQRVEEGEIGLDEPVSRYLPDYPQPGASATVRQLLNHTSGIVSYNDIPGWTIEEKTARAYTTAELITVFKDLPSRSAPGEAWAYSNSGYVLLGAILEAVTGKPWHQVVEEGTVRPLGLRAIGYGDQHEASPAAAQGYTAGPAGLALSARSTHMSLRHAAAGLAGTAGEVAGWTHALHHGQVVSPDLYAQMTAPTILPDGRPVPYGLGVAFADVRGRRVVRHDGRVAGFNNESLYIPSHDVVVVVLTNSDSPSTSPALLGRRLAALAVGEPYRLFSPVSVEARTLTPLFGVYRQAETGVTRRFLTRDGRFYMAREGAPEREVLAAGDDQFFYPDSFTWFRIERGADGAAVMRLHQDGAEQAEISTRTGDVPPAAPGAAPDAAARP